MEAKKLKSSKRIHLIGLLGSIALSGVLFGGLFGCASAKKSPTPETTFPSSQITPPPSAENVPDEIYGPPVPDAPDLYGPEPTPIKPINLVLGPGLARGFAFVGIIRVLEAEKIPIGAIFGTEMGAFIGTLYAMAPNLNQFEWSLQNFKQDVFISKPSLFFGSSSLGGGPTSGAKFENQLKAILDERDLSSSKIPLTLSAQNKATGLPFIIRYGNAARAVRAAMGTTSLFTPTLWEKDGEKTEAVSANLTRPFLVREARELGTGPVLVVNVLTQAESSQFEPELHQADLVIRPKLQGVRYFDFDKSTDIAYLGRKAILQQLSTIRKLVGITSAKTEGRSSP